MVSDAVAQDSKTLELFLSEYDENQLLYTDYIYIGSSNELSYSGYKMSNHMCEKGKEPAYYGDNHVT
ncbi:MAG: hypothetical protein WCP85_12425 [Mariniphaga sp.]